MQTLTHWNSDDLCLSPESDRNTHCYQFDTAVNQNYYEDDNTKLTQLNQET